MPETRDPSLKFDKLRQQAEALIQQQPDFTDETPSNMLELIHELKIYQAELEIQNEELKRAQNDLSELNREFQNLYEFAPCGYLALNAKGIITRANLTAVSLLQTNRQFLPGSGFSQYIARGWDTAYQTARQKAIKTREKQSIELPLKIKRNNPLWVQAEIETDQDSMGAVIQQRIILMDISEKKQAAEAVKRSEAKYKNMMESITDAVYVCSSDHTIEFVNAAMSEQLGRDATGEKCYQAIHGIDEPCEGCPLEKVRNGVIINQEKRSPLNNRSYHLTHIPIVNNDQTVSKLTIYRDITDYLAAVAEKEKTQLRLIQAQKIESIGTLTGGIAHDFNNIMGIILGNTELALEDVPIWNPVHTNLEEIKKASLRAANIVRQLLSFTRITDQKLQPMEIAPVIKDALQFLRSTIPTTIDIEQDICVTDETILADPTQINQIMMNLCINASHAMEQTGGKLTISLEKLYLDDDSAKNYPDLKKGKYIKVMVGDTGPGIDPKIIDCIFDPYFTTKGVGKGSGMGLAVVQGIIKSHSGYIKVDSIPGKGTKFIMLFPLVTEKPMVEVQTNQEISRGSETILFVDDEISIVNMVQRMFERLGYKVQTATTPQDALDRFALNPNHFDLVITDMTMPQMTGVKLSEKLMAIRPDIPIIICSGYSALVDEEKAKELGLAAYVMKPIDMRETAQTIRKILDRK